MKKISLLLVLVLLLGITGCASARPAPQVVASTRTVYDFTSRLCAGTDIRVSQLITENVSCLHDYSLNVQQVRDMEAAEVVVISGAGLEDFLSDLLEKCPVVIDSSRNISLLSCEGEDSHDHSHHHEEDAHIWLDPRNAKAMCKNICEGLCQTYPQYAENFRQNCGELEFALDSLLAYGENALSNLSCRELLTFHDGFGYFAHAFDLTIAAAVEEESGSEASAKTLISLIKLVQAHQLSAVFAETNGSTSAAKIISSETGVPIYTLDMAMSSDYFEVMYRNIDTLKEALG